MISMDELQNQRQLYITNLLTETLPDSLKTGEYISSLRISDSSLYTVVQLKLSADTKQKSNPWMLSMSRTGKQDASDDC